MPLVKEYWWYESVGQGWANIWCPMIDDKEGSESLGVKRKIYSEFKKLEAFLRELPGIIGWVAWTHLENDHIMRFFAKVGAKPYNIHLKDNQLWFCKEFNARE